MKYDLDTSTYLQFKKHLLTDVAATQNKSACHGMPITSITSYFNLWWHFLSSKLKGKIYYCTQIFCSDAIFFWSYREQESEGHYIWVVKYEIILCSWIDRVLKLRRSWKSVTVMSNNINFASIHWMLLNWAMYLTGLYIHIYRILTVKGDIQSELAEYVKCFQLRRS